MDIDKTKVIYRKPDMIKEHSSKTHREIEEIVKEKKSYNETKEHIKRVQYLFKCFIKKLKEKSDVHDNSKLEEPERSYFSNVTHRLKSIDYGSVEYLECLKELRPALNHHYQHNSHHPEHYRNGIDDMNLFDIIEMFLDWKAASERHTDGNFYKSIEISKKRFVMSDQLVNIFNNTVEHLKDC
jgi:hypothetical protein